MEKDRSECSFYQFKISLPQWLKEFYKKNYMKKFQTQEERMKLVIWLSEENVKQKSGGPFGAAIFDSVTHELISVGVNRVVPENSSIAHAEIVAIAMAEGKLKTYDLGSVKKVELITSSQPCIQCFGALIWAGIQKVVIGADAENVKRITGFDEGPLPENWKEELENRGVEVIRNFLSEEAQKVLREYSREGIIYNSSVQINQKKN